MSPVIWEGRAMKPIKELWTDGSYEHRTDVGAWAWVYGSPDPAFKSKPIDFKSGVVQPGRSSYAMEAKAILEALKAFPDDDLRIHTDHDGLQRQLSAHPTSLKLWISGARRARHNTGGAFEYLKDIEKSMRGRQVQFRKVKGHSGDPFNTLADREALRARRTTEKAMWAAANFTPTDHASVLGGWNDLGKP